MQAVEKAAKLEQIISIREGEAIRAKAEADKIIKPVTSKTGISTEQNKQLAAASELIARRAFSWSELLSDIERSLPAGVRVLRVAVAQVQPKERSETFDGTENAAMLGVSVIGKSGQDVTTMIDRMHGSGRFKVTPVSKKAVEGTEDIEFELKVEYYPRNSAARANQIAASQTVKMTAEKK